MSRIVVCANDFPHAVLTEGAADSYAIDLCRQLNDQDREDCEQRRQGDQRRVYYHWHRVPEFPVLAKPTGPG